MNDFTTVIGFMVALRDTLRVREGGLLHGGHPCNGPLVVIVLKLKTVCFLYNPSVTQK